MADKNFQLIIKELERIHKLHPDLRFGLVIQEAMDRFKNNINVKLHNYTSKEVLTALKRFEYDSQQLRTRKKILIKNQQQPLGEIIDRNNSKNNRRKLV